MKLFIFAALIALVAAKPQFRGGSRPPPAGGLNNIPIVRYTNNFVGDGSYNYAYETGHGINVQEQGYLKNAGTKDEAQVAEGSYSYVGPEGIPVSITYIADENGFRAEGDAIPTPPPIPDAILRALQRTGQLPGGSGPAPGRFTPGRGRF